MTMKWLVLTLVTYFLNSEKLTKKVSVSHTVIDSSIVDIQWLRSESNIILLLSSAGHLWRTKNNGKKFTDISESVIANSIIKNSNDKTFVSMHVHPKDRSVVFLMSLGVQHYLTNDSGITWIPFAAQAEINNFVWHPTKPTHALFSSWSAGCQTYKYDKDDECEHNLYVTLNGGQSYQLVASKIVQFNWASSNGNSETIFITKHNRLSGNQPRYGGWYDTVDFVSTSNYGKSFKTLISQGNKFLVTRNFVFVAKLENYQTQNVSLIVSSNFGNTFTKSIIPANLMEKSYTIIDTSEGTVVIHVNHGTGKNVLTGNVYVSDANGLRYSLSLANNVRSSTGECEFDKIMGLNGLYMANIYVDENENINLSSRNKIETGNTFGDQLQNRKASGKTMSKKKTGRGVRTVISFDKGGSWNFLTPPKVDSLSNPIICPDPDECYLNLHGITQFDKYAPFYSVDSAIGLIMATGNVGAYLDVTAETNTYISRDGGKSWHEAHKKNYIYEYGDHGGLVVMANDNVSTDQVVFSWNEGISWYDFNLGVENVLVDNIAIEPEAKSMNFLLYGMLNNKGIVFNLDFSTLNLPKCRNVNTPDTEQSDYMTWKDTPFQTNSSHCLLGREMNYIKRKPERECSNGVEFVRATTKRICICTKENYLCEVGFYRNIGTNNDCKPSPYEDRDYMRVEGCTSSGVYYTHAYRKIVGDECRGGWEPEKVPVPCPPDSPMDSSALASLSTVGLLLILIGLVAYASRHPKLRQYIHQSGINNFVEVGYSMVGRGEVLFNFWNTDQTNESAIEL